MSDPIEQARLNMNRRHFFSKASLGLGALTLGSLLGCGKDPKAPDLPTVIQNLHVPPKAKRIIYLFQSGGPSQYELYDHKPLLRERHGEELPDSIRKGQRLTGMTANQTSMPSSGAKAAPG